MADTIHIIASQLCAGRGPDEWTRRLVERPVPITTVQSNLDAFVKQVEKMLVLSCEKLGEFQLEEATFNVEMSPDGTFKLLGSNSAEISGGVRITLRRRHTVNTVDMVRHLVGTEPDDDAKNNLMRNHLTTRGGDPPVRVRVEGIVPVAEQNLPLPVIEVGL